MILHYYSRVVGQHWKFDVERYGGDVETIGTGAACFDNFAYMQSIIPAVSALCVCDAFRLHASGAFVLSDVTGPGEGAHITNTKRAFRGSSGRPTHEDTYILERLNLMYFYNIGVCNALTFAGAKQSCELSCEHHTTFVI